MLRIVTYTDDEDAQKKNETSYFQEMNRVIRKMVSEREVTAQEAALDAYGLPLIKYSCDVVHLQARTPEDTIHKLKPFVQWNKKRDEVGQVGWADVVYDPPVTKYLNRTLDLLLLKRCYYQVRPVRSR